MWGYVETIGKKNLLRLKKNEENCTKKRSDNLGRTGQRESDREREKNREREIKGKIEGKIHV